MRSSVWHPNTPHIAKEYFNNQKLQTVEIVKLNGSVELAPIVGLSEVIVDIVETGTTLKENGLEVLEEVCPLSARMVVNQVSQKMEQETNQQDHRCTKEESWMKKNRPEERNMRIVKVNKDSIANILIRFIKEKCLQTMGIFRIKSMRSSKMSEIMEIKLSLIIQHSLIKRRSTQTIF